MPAKLLQQLEGAPRLHYLEWNHCAAHDYPGAWQLGECVVVGTVARAIAC